jgi:hypothetical protein
MSPRAFIRGGVIAVHDPQADEVASLLLGVVAAGVGKSLGWPWVDRCRLDVLGWSVSP